MHTPDPLECAIFKTLAYADVFHFPLTPAEIHHYLLGQTASPDAILHTLQASPWLAGRVTRVNGYYALSPSTGEARHQRESIAAALWQPARRYGLWFSYLPFVRMVALTGSLAVRNPSDWTDDFDYLIVTRTGRVWLTRLLALVLVRLARLWGVVLCPNYVVSERHLAQVRRDLFVAHELAQMTPVAGHALYTQMRDENAWAEAFLPNAHGPAYPMPPHLPHPLGQMLQKIGEVLLGGTLGDRLEAWEYRRKARKFRPQATHDGAQVDAEQLKGHFEDHGAQILARYVAILRQHGLDEA